jgi:glutamine cyclotransferase
LELKKIVTVTSNGKPVSLVNEMEFIYGYLWANIFGETKIVKIDPNTGIIVNVLEMSPLVNSE